MARPAKPKLAGRMFLLCPVPTSKCSNTRHDCPVCGGCQVLVIKAVGNKIVMGPAETRVEKFDVCARSLRIQESVSAGTEWGHRHIGDRVYRRRRRRSGP